LVSPVTVPAVGAGLPVIVVGAWGVDPMNGVTVYVVTDPPVDGAVQVRPADV
jgi:hypothetical protein